MRRRLAKPASFSSALQRLGMALPPPFVGRHAELARMREGLAGTSVLVVLGSVGSGKSRLVRELAASSELPAVMVRSWAGDRPEAVRARAERALGATPGTLDRAVREQSCLVVIDDAHHVHGGASAAFGDLVRRPGNGRLLLVGREDLDLPTSGPTRIELHLEGLDPGAARELWAHLEETYGPTPAGSCDEALSRTRGVPLALRREYACAASGKQAWAVERLATDVREALETVAVVGGASVAPSGVAALAPSIAVEPALIELVSRQLIDPLEDGRFSIHDVVRDQVLSGMAGERRATLERGAAELALRGPSDDGALGLVHPIDRLRVAVHHLVAAGDRAAAEAVLVERGGAAPSRSSGGELLGLIDFVRGERSAPPTRLAELAGATLARRGRIAAALALGGPADPVERAVLHFRAGDEPAARALLEPLVGDGEQSGERTDLRARAAAALVDIELRRGVPGRLRARAG